MYHRSSVGHFCYCCHPTFSFAPRYEPPHHHVLLAQARLSIVSLPYYPHCYYPTLVLSSQPSSAVNSCPSLLCCPLFLTLAGGQHHHLQHCRATAQACSSKPTVPPTINLHLQHTISPTQHVQHSLLLPLALPRVPTMATTLFCHHLTYPKGPLFPLYLHFVW